MPKTTTVTAIPTPKADTTGKRDQVFFKISSNRRNPRDADDLERAFADEGRDFWIRLDLGQS